MNKYEGQQRNTGEPVFKIKKETKEPILQLKDKWPRLYDCLACRYFKCDEKSLPFDEHFGRSQIYIGRERYRWYIEAPRVALVGSGTRPQ